MNSQELMQAMLPIDIRHMDANTMKARRQECINNGLFIAAEQIRLQMEMNS